MYIPFSIKSHIAKKQSTIKPMGELTTHNGKYFPIMQEYINQLNRKPLVNDATYDTGPTIRVLF